MKIRVCFILFAVFICARLNSQTTGNSVIDNFLNSYSERAYSTVPVTDQQLDLVLKCGIKSPSSRNGQPWKFTVISDETVMKEIVRDAVAGNILIVISGTESQTGTTPDFDCGLTTSAMFFAAHGLGLGARIYGSPVAAINAKKDYFQIPAGYKAVIVLRIGNTDKSVDAVSAATPRKKADELINYRR